MHRRPHLAACGILVAGALTSCDTLKARREASEAASLYKDGKLKEAAERYNAAEQLDPGIDVLHLNLGFTYLQLFSQSSKGPKADEYGKRAIEEFEDYIRRRPKDAERGRKYLLQAFVDTKRYDDAVTFFKPEVERPKPSLEALSILAQIAAKVGRFQDALNWYEKRIDAQPGEVDGYNGAGTLIWDYLHKSPQLAPVERVRMADRGIHWLKKSIELNAYPPEPYTYVNLLYRERSAAHKCQLTDAGTAVQDGGVAVNDAGVGGCPQITADLKEAQKYFEVAMAKYRERSGAKPDGGAKDAPKDSKAGKAAPPAGKGGAK